MIIRTASTILGVTLLVAGCGDSTPAAVVDSGMTDSGSADVVAPSDNGGRDVPGQTDAGNDVTAQTDAVTDAVTDAATDAPTSDVPADPWACLGHVTTPTATPGTGMVTISAQDFQSGMGLPGVTVKVCGRADTNCTSPLSMGNTNAMGNAMVSLTVPAGGLDCYVQFTDGTGMAAVVPTRSFIVFYRVPSGPAVFALVPQQTFTLLGAVYHATLDATHGAIAYGVNNCTGRAAGASVATMPDPMGATPFYIAAGLPSTSASQTDSSGQGGYFNVPPGAYTVTGTRVSPMTRIGSRAMDVRGGYFSSFNVDPSP